MKRKLGAALWGRRLALEQLEARQLLTGYQPTAIDQLMLEQLNNIRANPAAYGQSIGLDLSNVAPSQPLAFNTQLIQAATDHSTDMSTEAYFAHITPAGLNPGQQISAAGYNSNAWGQSIAGGTAYPGPADALSALIIDAGVPDLGHRQQLLDLNSIYNGQNEVGIGVLQSSTGPLVNYYTIDTASTQTAQSFLTGVVYNDANGNGQYDIGEGMGGVTIAVSGVGSVQTFNTGGYSIGVQPGVYTITASGGGLPSPQSEMVTVGTSNVQVNFTTANSVTAIDTQYIQNLFQKALGRVAGATEVGSWLAVMQGPAGAQGVATGIEMSVEALTRRVDGYYEAYLGRAPGTGEDQVFINGLIHGASDENVIAGIVGSQEYFQRASAMVNTGSVDDRYVQSLYQSLLNRQASQAELNYWASAMQMTNDAMIAEGILYSFEYRSDVITGYYMNILDRTSAPSTQEIANWANSNLDLANIRIGFESSQEFINEA